MSTSSPYAAPTDSRLKTIACSGITTERTVSSSSRNAMPSTNANTNGRCEFIAELKSAVPAVSPVTPA